MRLRREEVVQGYDEELQRFGELVGSLSDEEWQTPTRCEGWTTADVAAHVVGTLSDIAGGRFDRIGPEGVASIVAERRGRSQQELAEELEGAGKVGRDLLASFDDAAWSGPAPTDLTPTLGEGVEALWYDAYVHNEDIRAATGRPELRGPGLRCAVGHLADLLEQGGYGPATLALDGLEEFPIKGGGGQRITGDPHQFVLVATGRADPATMGLDETVNVYRA